MQVILSTDSFVTHSHDVRQTHRIWTWRYVLLLTRPLSLEFEAVQSITYRPKNRVSSVTDRIALDEFNEQCAVDYGAARRSKPLDGDTVV